MGGYLDDGWDAWSDDDTDHYGPEIDVCQHCGGYFAWTPEHTKAAEKHGEPGRNPQRCMRCITGEGWVERRPPLPRPVHGREGP